MRRRNGIVMLSRGFTLVELLIVITIIGAITAVALPKMVNMFHGRAVPNAADQFVAAHGFARATAIRYGRLAELHIDVSNNRYWVEIDTSGAGNRMKAGGYRYVSDNVGMTSNRSLVCFDQRGLPTARTTTAGLTCQDADFRTIFSLGSRVDTVQTTALGKVLR